MRLNSSFCGCNAFVYLPPKLLLYSHIVRITHMFESMLQTKIPLSSDRGYFCFKTLYSYWRIFLIPAINFSINCIKIETRC